MGGHDCTATSCRVLAYEPHQRGAMREVHPTCGLIQQEQLGRERERRCNGDPLSLTDRAIPGITIREVDKVQSSKHLLGDSQVAPERAWPEQDLVSHGVTEQRAARVLGHEGDERHTRLGTHWSEIAAVDEQATARGGLEPSERAEQRALATTVGAEQCRYLPRLQGGGGVADDDAVATLRGEAVERYERGSRWRFRGR